MRNTFASLAFAFIGVASVPTDAGAYALSPLAPGKWGAPVPGTPAHVTWSLMPTGTSCVVIRLEPSQCAIVALAAFLPGGFMSEVFAAFNAWSAVANITFAQVPDDGRPEGRLNASGDIRLGGHDLPSGDLAHAFYPPPHAGPFAGDIHLDTGTDWDIGAGGDGIDVFQVLVHEIGHSIGLAHSTAPNAVMGQYYTTAFRGPQADDILGARHLYGARSAGAQSVPEPPSMALLAAAATGVAYARRRARRKAAASPAT